MFIGIREFMDAVIAAKGKKRPQRFIAKRTGLGVWGVRQRLFILRDNGIVVEGVIEKVKQ